MTDLEDRPPVSEGGEAVGLIGNYYGGLAILEWGGRYWWSVENYHGCDWHEIPESLHRALQKYEHDRKRT